MPTDSALSNRDRTILEVVHGYSTLKLKDIRRVVFPESESPKIARRGIRRLREQGLLSRKSFGPEDGLVLTPAGAEAIEKPIPSHPPQQLRSLWLTELFVSFDLALQDLTPVALQRRVAFWERKSHTFGLQGKQQLRLYHSLECPVSKKPVILHPDGLIMLRGKGAASYFRRLFFVQIDEDYSLSKLFRIARGYSLCAKQEKFRKWGKVDNFTVLLLTRSQRRLEQVRAYLAGLYGNERFWLGVRGEVTEESALTKAVWRDVEGIEKRVLKG